MNPRLLLVTGCLTAVIIGIAVWPKEKKGDHAAVAASVSTQTAKKIYDQANAFRKDSEILKAKEAYKKLLADYPDFENIAQAQRDLEDINLQILMTNVDSPQSVMHEVQTGDTLGKLAKVYGTTVELIKRRNNITNDTIRLGQRLSIWKGTFNIVVDKSQNTLLLMSNGDIIKRYTVSTGKDISQTPAGEFTITSKLVNPVWFHRGVVVPPESPENVLGTRWLGFNVTGYGIHGTVDPNTIGSHETAGCVRLRNNEVEELYDLVKVGTPVVIIE